MCRRIEPALSDGEAGYKSFIGNLEKQRTHADSVLTPIRDELAAICVALEKATAII